ncbi:uncharacterized protein BDZ99DRAFT_483883 [Mytilinidion resinicola]|uniref:Chromatin modification-related protein n=1 Tax=Mytilinidion resinicola TaxID=574789 RepID=A0A6A6Z6K9_9PEZI|nr:uncharacterized protein BDZ99DRAFT_483883 [Mytilinidion resinicola]KAF2816726.1 hypothetical protein BDZ99DRAFT_483883 [Mytilinidion resinicola]
MTPQPPSNPDAHTTVNDFLDYTEFFPSDLYRSMILIKDLDVKYKQAAQHVHELTKSYANLPKAPENERADPQELRREISVALENAIFFRESSHAEAVRICEVAERHAHRIAIIKRKLQALPQPPSRDPTPAPVSPQATRSANKYNTTPRLHLNFDPVRQPQTTIPRPRDRSRKNTITLGPLDSPTPSDVSEWGSSRPGSSSGSAIEVTNQKGIKVPKKGSSKVPKPPRVRPPGAMGTNVHSQLAGISTSNALARLSPPPEDAKPGSRYRPWFKLTEYEMALLRKQMKKNAIWSPSDTMIRRELQKKDRGLEAYEAAKKEAEETGVPLLDEESADRSSNQGGPLAPGEISHDTWGAQDSQLVNRGMKLNEAKRLKRESLLREQALRDAMEIEDASRQIMVAGTRMKNLFPGQGENVTVTPLTEKKKEPARSARKRKRDSTPPVSPDSAPVTTGPKRLRIAPPVPPVLAPAPKTPQTPVAVPLAPAGPPAPSVGSKATSKPPSRKPTPALPSPTESKKPATAPAPAPAPPPPPPPPPQPQPTAAASRPRRASVAPKQASSPAPEPAASSAIAHRPRSSRGVITPKAASAEPPAASTSKTRDLRRASNVSLPAAPQVANVLATRTSNRRRRLPPLGAVTAGEDGQAGVQISVLERQTGSKNKKRSTAGNVADEPDQPIRPGEPTYCICRDVSYGTMVACENDNCRTEWFHIECMGMKRAPAQSAIWYCPDCRVLLNKEEFGKPISAPAASVKRSGR